MTSAANEMWGLVAMIWRKARNRGPVIQRAVVVIVACSLLFVQSGCAVGYITYHTDAAEQKLPPPELAAIKISYAYTSPDRNVEKDASFPLAFERTLRSRFHILDLHKAEWAESRNAERFVISVQQHSEANPINYVLGSIHMFSFAIIPVVLQGRENIVFSVRSPLGVEKRYEYSYSERAYSWLPFMFFAPEFFAAPMVAQDYVQQDEIRVLENITTRFMIDAAPFIKEQSDQHAAAREGAL